MWALSPLSLIRFFHRRVDDGADGLTRRSESRAPGFVGQDARPPCAHQYGDDRVGSSDVRGF
jgi:hypothetical protein